MDVVIQFGRWLALFLLAASCFGATITVTQTIKNADGSNFQGYVMVSNPAFTAIDGVSVAGNSIGQRFPTSPSNFNGTVTVALEPTVGSIPSGVTYTVRYFSTTTSGRMVWSERWVVPNSSPQTISAVRINTTPTPSSAIQPGQITSGGATDGQFFRYTTSTQSWAGFTLFSNTNPNALGTVAPGTQVRAAREDHVHPAVDLSGTAATGILAAARFPALGGDVATVAGALGTTINENLIKYSTTSLTNAQIKALRATPVTVVSAPGSGKVLQFISAVLFLDYGSNVLTEAGDNLAFRYNNTTGAIVSETIETTGFIDQSADTLTTARAKLDGIASKAASENLPLVLHNIGGAEFAGNAGNDTVMRVKVSYRVHSTGW